MFERPLLTIFSILAGLVLLLIVGAVAAVMIIGPKSFIEERISAALDRQVSIGDLKIGWGNPLKVEIGDFRLANAPWGSTPDMVRVAHVSAEIDPKALFSGLLIYRKLVVDKPVVVLERNPDGIGNWRFGSGLRVDQVTVPDANRGGLAVIPRNRRQFPVLLDFALHNAMISYRAYSGNVLHIGLDDVTIQAADADQPVDIEASGSYNGHQLALSAQTQSLNILRDGTSPFGTTFSLKRDTARLDFTGTMTEPLDFEGVRGPMRIKADKLNDLLDIFNVPLAGNPSAEVTGDLTKQGPLWNVMAAKGRIADTDFTANLILLEGNRVAVDDIKLELKSNQIDLGSFLGDAPILPQGKEGGDWLTMPLDAPDSTAPKLGLKLAATAIKYGGLQIGDVGLDAQIAPGAVRLNQAAFTLAEAKLRLKGALDPVVVDGRKEGARLSAEMQFGAVDAAKLAMALGGATSDLGGKIDGTAVMTMQGKTLRDAVKTSAGGLVLAMNQGRISRDLLERSATDLRSLFRKGKGSASVSCLLGVMRVENGIGLLDPLRLRSPDATVTAAGRVNLLAQSLDITLQSDAKSTGLFALDIPLRISGNWRKPRVEKAGKPPEVRTAADVAADLPAPLLPLVRQNSCSQ